MAVQLHYDVAGEKHLPPLILSSALGSTGDIWDWQLSAFSSLFHTISYDHRGHGRSPAPPGPYSIDDLGSDVLDLMDRLEIERAHFCGLSLGGMVGLWLGVHAPQRLSSLTLCCTSARPGNTQMWGERAAAVLAEQSVAGVAGGIVAKWVTPEYAQANAEEVAGLRSMLAGSPPEGYAACCRVVEAVDFVDELPLIATPTLVISGASDEALPPAHQRVIADGIPGARLATIDPGAHLPNIEQPQVFSDLVAEHVRANP
ncbi:MAG TPA: 3-oxoadipate enol-lactonase [Baekduia sp.]|nr:3-oxoadipate enol-lactonase [Baekduia sp.]